MSLTNKLQKEEIIKNYDVNQKEINNHQNATNGNDKENNDSNINNEIIIIKKRKNRNYLNNENSSSNKKSMEVNLEGGIKDLENNIDVFNNNISILQPINIKNNKNKKYEDSHEEKEKKLESPCTVLTKKINNKPTRNRKKIIMYNSIQINKSSNSIGNKISTSILPLKNENIPQKTVSIKENG